MKNKRGLSGVVATILIILLVLVVLAIVGGVVLNFVKKGANQLSASKYSVRLSISSAKMNYTTGISSVRVARDIGTGDLVGVKFIFEDSKSSEVFDYPVVGFDELEERTFDIFLNTGDLILVLADLQKVSVAPIIILESGEKLIGIPSEPIFGLNRGMNDSGAGLEEGSEEGICSANLDCGDRKSVV